MKAKVKYWIALFMIRRKFKNIDPAHAKIMAAQYVEFTNPKK